LLFSQLFSLILCSSLRKHEHDDGSDMKPRILQAPSIGDITPNYIFSMQSKIYSGIWNTTSITSNFLFNSGGNARLSFTSTYLPFLWYPSIQIEDANNSNHVISLSSPDYLTSQPVTLNGTINFYSGNLNFEVMNNGIVE
jgi:hypothetical protein